MFNFKKVIHHFDRKSEKYDLNSKTLPWSLIRYFESNIILKLVGKIKNKEILDVGSGSGYYSKIMIKNKAKIVFALDASQKMLNQIKDKKVKKICQNAESFLIKKKFEVIICAGLLEFVNSPQKVLKNIRRVSRTNSKLIILYPSNNFLAKIYKFYHSRNGVKIILFDDDKIKNIFKNTGWKILKSKNIFFSNVMLLKPI
tara:strand:- start:577 stop:1176 length:600 start_codon:yes stop_codon:yes gene_type:complete